MNDKLRIIKKRWLKRWFNKIKNLFINENYSYITAILILLHCKIYYNDVV